MNTFNISLEIDKSSPLSPEGIAIRQGDVNGTTLIATIYDHGTKLATTGLTPYLIMELPDHEHSYSQAGTYSNGVVTVIINEKQAASVSGVVENAYIELRQSSTVIASTESFRVVIRPDARADKEIGETYSSEIEAAIQELETAIAQAETQIEADVAEWLDQHPEATTTVQDGSITYAKLHSSTKQRLGNKLHRLVTAPVVTASDAYAAPPVALVVDGKSVQDGTPTPDAPVAIQSVESVGLAAAGVNLARINVTANATQEGITWTYLGDGIWQANGTVSVNSATARSFTTFDCGVLPAGTYTAYCQMIGGTSPDGHIVRVGSGPSASYFRSGTNVGDTAKITFTLAEPTRICVTPQLKALSTVSNAQFLTWLSLGSEATPYVPYVGSTTPIPLQGHALRSLPDGTHDELRVDADGNVTLVQRVGSADMGALNYTRITNGSVYLFDAPVSTMKSGDPANNLICSGYEVRASVGYGLSDKQLARSTGARELYFRNDAYTDAASFKAAMGGIEVQYALATPVTYDLGTVSLPSMPAPDLTAWASCTPATEIELDYERDVTIAVERLEAQIAEIATA